MVTIKRPGMVARGIVADLHLKLAQREAKSLEIGGRAAGM